MSERGGAVYGLLAAIGFVVVVMAIMFAVCVGNAGASHRCDRRHPCRDDQHTCFAGCWNTIVVPGLTDTTTTTRSADHG